MDPLDPRLPALITGGASFMTAIGGCVMAYAAVVSARRRAAGDCTRALDRALAERDAARLEAEQARAELHRKRMRRPPR